MQPVLRPLLILGLCGSLAACGTLAPRTAEKVEPPARGGGYYKDDGPGSHPPADLAAIPDAVPRIEPLNRRANEPYQAFGKTYTPIKTAQGYRERGLASWYGRRYHGKPTSTGETYDMYAMTAAHATLPIPSYARVTNIQNGKSVIVRINDRGPFHGGRLIDLSYTAAWKLDILRGVTPVEVEAIPPGEPVITHTAVTEVNARPDDKPVSPQTDADSVPTTGAQKTAAVRTDREVQTPGRTELPVSRPKPEVAARPMVKTTAVAVPDAPAKALFLQFAAVSSPAAADALIQKLRSRLGDRLPTVESINEGALYKVQAGPFASVDLADQLAVAWQQDSGVKPFRVTRVP